MAASPVEPLPTAWEFPDPRQADGDVVGVGADLEPGTILAAYRRGMFPMPLDRRRLGWWSPTPRAILPLRGDERAPDGALRVSRSLRKSREKFEIRFDTAFSSVIDGCAAPSRQGRWITAEVAAAYRRLHDLGWVHSVEAWDEEGELAGGLYGVCIGGLFAGESMFHRRTDASKVALVALVDRLQRSGATLLDVQWRTPHLASLGVIEIPRDEYLGRLDVALRRRPPCAFSG